MDATSSEKLLCAKFGVHDAMGAATISAVGTMTPDGYVGRQSFSTPQQRSRALSFPENVVRHGGCGSSIIWSARVICGLTAPPGLPTALVLLSDAPR